MAEAEREVTVTFLIADLSGYTALTEAHGDQEGLKVVSRYVELAAGALRDAARLAERVGDELLIVAAEPGAAVRTALALREAVEREPLFPAVRAGIHAGRVLEQGGRYFGGALNLTARVAAHARGGQILCTPPVAAVVAGLPDVECRSLGRVRFRNIAEPVEVFEVVAGRAEEARVIDPVCRMQLVADTAPARLPFGGATYHFCSLPCARAFAERPDLYAGA